MTTDTNHQTKPSITVDGGSVTPDATYQVAINFLERKQPGGPWVLTAIVPDGKPTFTAARNANEVRRFIAKHNGQRNIYYSVNRLKTTEGKLSRRMVSRFCLGRGQCAQNLSSQYQSSFAFFKSMTSLAGGS